MNKSIDLNENLSNASKIIVRDLQELMSYDITNDSIRMTNQADFAFSPIVVFFLQCKVIDKLYLQGISFLADIICE